MIICERVNNVKRIITVFGTRVHLALECAEENKQKVIDIFMNFNEDIEDFQDKNIYIFMDKEKIEIKSADNYKSFYDYLGTDIYPIMYSIVYELARAEGGLGVHSVAVEKNGRVILIFGDYGVGKSTLALSFEEKGWEIISTDQTIIKKCDNKLQVMAGSKYMKYNDKCLIYNGKNNCAREIYMMVGIKGLAQNGAIDVSRNTRNLLRVLWEYCVWPWNTLICGFNSINDLKKDENMESVKKILCNINIPLYYVRGDSDGVRDMLIELSDKMK